MKKVLLVVGIILACFLTACGPKSNVAHNVEVSASHTTTVAKPFSGLYVGMTMDEASEVLGDYLHESESGEKITDKNGKTTSKKWKNYSCAYEVFSVDGELEFTVPKGQDSVSEIKWSGHTKDVAVISDEDVKEFISQVKSLYDDKYTVVEEDVLDSDGRVIDAEKYKTFVWKYGEKKVARLEIKPHTENFEPDDRLTFNIYIK